jgi:hypothetical protein
VLDALSGYPEWDLAVCQRGIILLHYPSGRRRYNRENLQRLLLPIRAREVRLVDKDNRTVPAEAEWKFSPHDGILRVIGPNQPPEPEYPDPRLDVSTPNPEVPWYPAKRGELERAACQALADHPELRAKHASARQAAIEIAGWIEIAPPANPETIAKYIRKLWLAPPLIPQKP